MPLLQRIKNTPGPTVVNVFGWLWTAFGGLILLISVASLLIDILQRQMHFPNQPTSPFLHAVFRSITLALIGSSIVLASQATIRKKVWGWRMLRIIISMSLIFILYKSTFGHQFPTYQNIHQTGQPAVMGYVDLFFAILVSTIWIAFFAVSFVALNLKQVNMEFEINNRV